MRDPQPDVTVPVGSGLVWLLAAVSVVVFTASWFAPALPVDGSDTWRLVQRGLGVNAARSVPSWWMAVLFVVAALSCHGRALWERRHGRRWSSVAWWWVAAAMTWISVDHALAVHEALRRVARGVLPAALSAAPVETALLVLVLPAALLLLAVGDRGQRGLLVAAGACYVLGQVAVGAGWFDLRLSSHRAALTEAGLQWAAAILLVATCARGGPDREM